MAKRPKLVAHEVSRTYSVEIAEDIAGVIHLHFQDALIAELLDIFGVSSASFAYHGDGCVKVSIRSEYQSGTKDAVLRFLRAFTEMVRASLSIADAILIKADEDYSPVSVGVSELHRITKGSEVSPEASLKLLSKIKAIRMRPTERGLLKIDLVSPGILEELRHAYNPNGSESASR